MTVTPVTGNLNLHASSRLHFLRICRLHRRGFGQLPALNIMQWPSRGMSQSLLSDPHSGWHVNTGRTVALQFCGTTVLVMGPPAGMARLKRLVSIAVELASRTILPVPNISRYAGTRLCSQ